MGFKQEEKPAEEKPEEKSEEKPADKKSEEKPADEKSEEKPADKKSEEKPADEKSEEKPADEKSEEKPADEKSEEKPADEKSEEKPADEKPEEKENLPTQHEDNAFTPNPALMASLYPQHAQAVQTAHAAASEHLEAIGEEAEPLDTSPNQSCDSFSQRINDMMPAADDDLDVEALLGLPPMPEPPTSSSGLPEPPTSSSGLPEPPTSSSGLPEPLTNSSSLPEPLTNSSGLPEPLTNSSSLPEAPATDVAALNQTVAHSEKDLESLDFAAMTKEEKGYYLNMLLTKAMGRINAIPVDC